LSTTSFDLVRQLRVPDSLLFLNKVLAVSRHELADPETEFLVNQLAERGTGFVIT